SAGWAAGSTTDRILRTTDGGSHWNDVTPRGARLGTWTTFFLDADNAWLASSLQPGSPTNDFSVEIYRTLDGGRNWSQVGMSVTRDGGRKWVAVALRVPQLGTPTCDCSIESLRFWDKQHGALVLNDAYQDARGYAQNFLYTTTDGGRSWQLGPLLPGNAFSVF